MNIQILSVKAKKYERLICTDESTSIVSMNV